jgi:hypothetical protein
MGDRRRRLEREDLEAMRQEFVVGEQSGSLDDDLHQIRRSARLGVSPEDWARARKLAPAYAGRFGGTWIRKSNLLERRKITHLGDAPPAPGIVE